MISLIVPSRGRPHRLKEMWDSFTTNTASPLELIATVDEDDPRLNEYMNMDSYDIHIIVVPRMPLTKKINETARHANGEIYIPACDCSLMQTKNWDKLFKQSVPTDGYYIACPNDGHKKNSTVFICTTPTWIDAVGYYAWEGTEQFYGETWAADIAKRCGRLCLLPEITLLHRNPGFGDIETDETFEHQHRNNDKHVKTAKKAYDAAEPERARIAEKIRQKIQGDSK